MLVANLTTRQYFECADSFEIENCLRHLLSVNKEDTAILKADVGESIWRRDDRIVNIEEHLEEYVKKEFGGIYIHDEIKKINKIILPKKTMLVANLTTRQYIEYIESFEIDNCLRHLLSVNNKYTAILKADIGESTWRRDDRIVYVEQHLEKYVKKEFGGVYIHDVIKNKTRCN